MTTTTKLDPAAITPETILAAAARRGLALVPGTYFHMGPYGLVGCCPVAVLALEVDESIRSGIDAERTLAGASPSRAFTAAMVESFDGYHEKPNAGPDGEAGFALGRAVRSRLGLDAGGEGGRA